MTKKRPIPDEVRVENTGDAEALAALQEEYRAFKQRTLLEEADLIYRINKVMPRRIFYVNVGKTAGSYKRALREFKKQMERK